MFFTEGGGGRPGDTDGSGVSGLDCLAFNLFAQLSGLVPLVGITSGYCFAGNAAILGCCDVIIATAGSNIGMGGPAMIEGGGLGVYEPRRSARRRAGAPTASIDVAVADEAAAVRVAKQYLSYFQGRGGSAGNAASSRLDHDLHQRPSLPRKSSAHVLGSATSYSLFGISDGARAASDAGVLALLLATYGLGRYTYGEMGGRTRPSCSLPRSDLTSSPAF